MMKPNVETVTPALAAKWLESNIGNRPVRHAWVQVLAQMMRAGEWTVTHQGIAFDRTGRLVDGQHRLLAVIEADRSVSMLVTRGLAPEVYRHLDGGRSRSISDRISLLDDFKENTLVTALVRAYLACAMGGHTGVSINAVEEQFLKMPGPFTAVAKAFNKANSRGLTRAPVGAAIASYMHAHEPEARDFLAAFTSGEGLSAGSPILTLRDALLLRPQFMRTAHEVYWKATTACRAAYEGRTMARLWPDTTDWQDNRYERLVQERSAKAKRAAHTRWSRVAV